MKRFSLRARLALIILLPLLLISIVAGYWRYSVARETAEQVFDRTLLLSAIAISRDVTVSDGDAISPATTALMRDTSGGRIFYHVHGPDGVFITGYATPPVPPLDVAKIAEKPVFYRARYRGADVRVVRLRERSNIGGVEGFSTVTAWQSYEGREALAKELGRRATLLLAGMMASIAILVWFGIRFGLSPLTDLQAAVSQRSTDDLRTIKRVVPTEVKGLVATLNGLFEQLAGAIQSRDAFIANAAHQLRNPIAAVLSSTEAAQSAKTLDETKRRLNDVAAAAHHASRLASQMLSYETVKAQDAVAPDTRVDLGALVREVLERNAARVFEAGVDLAFDHPDGPTTIAGNELLLSEALENIIDNALTHGGKSLSAISVRLRVKDATATLSVSDDGAGILPSNRLRVFERFEQEQPGTGSGLGLSIVEAVASRHGGTAVIEDTKCGTTVSLILPLTR